MPGLSRKETDRLLEHIAPQGVKITPTKNGQLLRLPNGDRTVVHYSVSDHRGPQKLKASLKRAGVTWPTDKHEQNSKRKGRPYPHTLSTLDPVLRKLGEPERVKNADIRAQLPPGVEIPNGTIRTYMLWRGYESRGRTVAQYWVKPEPEPVQIVEPEPTPKRKQIVPSLEDVPVPEPEPVPPADPAPELTPAADPEHHAERYDPERIGTFEIGPSWVTAPEDVQAAQDAAEPRRLDDHEHDESEPVSVNGNGHGDDASWVIDWDALEDTPLSQIRKVLWAAGVDVELRAKRG